MTVRVADLSGALLDLWVARAEGKCYTQNPGVWGNALINDLGRLSISKNSWDCARYFEPSKNWGHGGPIIQSVGISIAPVTTWAMGPSWEARMPQSAGLRFHDESPLVAAMRAYVASRFGDVVDKVDAPCRSS